ncbi:unnamed protein product, partial [Urochloa humidicola]
PILPSLYRRRKGKANPLPPAPTPASAASAAAESGERERKGPENLLRFVTQRIPSYRGMELRGNQEQSGQDGSEENGGPGSDDTQLDETRKLTEALDKLKSMCNVMGISYQSKLAEFGSKICSERVEEQLAFLTVTRDANFLQLKEISTKMMEAWRRFNTPMSRIEDFS